MCGNVPEVSSPRYVIKSGNSSGFLTVLTVLTDLRRQEQGGVIASLCPREQERGCHRGDDSSSQDPEEET